jgi:hypothetical protein
MTSPTDSVTATLLQLSLRVSSESATVSKLFAIFVRIVMVETHSRLMEASDIENDITIQFLVGGLDIHFAVISHLSCSAQKLFKIVMLVQ